MKNLTQHQWNTWFIINLFILVATTLFCMVANTQSEKTLSTIILLTFLVISFIPCLYIGTKPEDN